MKEQESKDRVLTPEYWDSHWMDDACKPVIPKLIHPEARAIDILVARKFSKETLQLFYDLPEKNVLKKFEKGEEFDPALFPSGTVIQFVREQIQSPFYNRKYNYQKGVYIGVVNKIPGIKRGEMTRLLVHPQYQNQHIHVDNFSVGPTEISVGEVVHEKSLYKTSTQNIVRRFDWVKVFEQPESGPEFEKERATIMEKFLPNTQKD